MWHPFRGRVWGGLQPPGHVDGLASTTIILNSLPPLPPTLHPDGVFGAASTIRTEFGTHPLTRESGGTFTPKNDAPHPNTEMGSLAPQIIVKAMNIYSVLYYII